MRFLSVVCSADHSHAHEAAILEVYQCWGLAVESKVFKRHVQEVLRPQPHHTEKYVIKHNWEAYDGSRQPYTTSTDVVMLIQASPDRWALQF